MPAHNEHAFAVFLKRYRAKLAEFEAVVVETSQIPYTMLPHHCGID